MPKSIAILGSGAVGVEFASIFRRFGSEVTIVELLPRLVPVEDEAVSAELEKSFRKQGITAHTGARVTSATASGDGVEVDAQLADGSTQTIRADYLLVATGRGPVTDGLDVERVGLQLEKGYIKVDAQYRTNVPGHLGDRRRHHARDGRRIRSWRMCRRPKASSPPSGSPGREARPLNYDHVPGCTYCDPEIGSVGLTEREAQERGYDVRVGTFPFGVLGRAKMAGETEGLREDRRREEVRRGARRPHDRPALDRARRRGDARAAARVDGRGADPHDPRASDDGRGGRRGGACRARRGDSLVNESGNLVIGNLVN